VFYTDLRTNSKLCTLHNIEWVFITEMDSVYCAVRTESLYITQKHFVFKGLFYVLHIGHIKIGFSLLSNVLFTTFKFQWLG